MGDDAWSGHDANPDAIGTALRCLLASELPTAPWWPYEHGRQLHRLLAKADVVQVLAASRGEPGILGDGVRQAQLRDPTYAPALEVARELSQPRVGR